MSRRLIVLDEAEDAITRSMITGVVTDDRFCAKLHYSNTPRADILIRCRIGSV